MTGHPDQQSTPEPNLRYDGSDSPNPIIVIKPVEDTVPSPLRQAREFTTAALAAAHTDDLADSLQRLVHAACKLIPARWAAIAVLGAHLSVPAKTHTSTDPGLIDTVLRAAVRAGTSPGWEAARHGGLRHSPDLAIETGYGSWPADLVQRTPIRSTLAVAFTLRDDSTSGGVLNVYSDRPHAFGPDQLDRAQLLADHCALVVDRAVTARDAATLQLGLRNARVIGAAVGILIERHRLSYDQAFDQLRQASQRHNQKLATVAEDFVLTGVLPP